MWSLFEQAFKSPPHSLHELELMSDMANPTQHFPVSKPDSTNFMKFRNVDRPILRLSNIIPDQIFHILVRACLTEKQLNFGSNRKTIVFVLCLTL